MKYVTDFIHLADRTGSWGFQTTRTKRGFLTTGWKLSFDSEYLVQL